MEAGSCIVEGSGGSCIVLQGWRVAQGATEQSRPGASLLSASSSALSLAVHIGWGQVYDPGSLVGIAVGSRGSSSSRGKDIAMDRARISRVDS